MCMPSQHIITIATILKCLHVRLIAMSFAGMYGSYSYTIKKLIKCSLIASYKIVSYMLQSKRKCVREHVAS